MTNHHLLWPQEKRILQLKETERKSHSVAAGSQQRRAGRKQLLYNGSIAAAFRLDREVESSVVSLIGATRPDKFWSLPGIVVSQYRPY